ncbi:hypothetical protein ACLB2K_066197 [Fragaria x ananassa]
MTVQSFFMTALSPRRRRVFLLKSDLQTLLCQNFFHMDPRQSLERSSTFVQVGIPTFTKTKEGTIFEWKVEKDNSLCTVQDVFKKVDHSMGFNIELKFDDQFVYIEKQFRHVLQVVLQVVNKHANDRPIMFSSFQPDVVLMIRKLQSTYAVRSTSNPYALSAGKTKTVQLNVVRLNEPISSVFHYIEIVIYPVHFLTNGGSKIYKDVRRNSLEEAIKVCIAGGLQGIVSEVRAILRDSNAVTRIKDSNLCLLVYGQLNNIPEKDYMQHLMGVEGVIVDLVGEITKAVSDLNN